MNTKTLLFLAITLSFCWDAYAQPGHRQVSTYCVKGDTVYYLSGIIYGSSPLLDTCIVEKADAKTFREVKNKTNYFDVDYAKDKYRVYFHGETLEGADAATFDTLFPDNNYVYADTFHVFYNGKLLPQTDRNTLRQVGENCFKDKNHVYKWYFDTLAGADAGSFEIIIPATPNSNREFYRDNKHVYVYRGNIDSISGADPASFHYLFYSKSYSDPYTADKNHVYDSYNGMVDSADPATFQEIENARFYFKDKNHVYFLSDIVAGADPATARAVRNRASEDKYLEDIIADNKQLYYRGKPIEGADSATFYPAGGNFWIDKNNIFNNHYSDCYKIVETANPANFLSLLNWGDNVIISNHDLYDTRGNIDLANTDYASIAKHLDRSVLEIILPYVPYDSRRGEYEARSGKYEINGHQLLYFDYDTREEILLDNDVKIGDVSTRGLYLKCKNRIFFRGKELANADAGSFEWIRYIYAKDKNHYYAGGEITDAGSVK